MPEPGRASSSIELTDPRALRAVAHPLRLALVGLLRREGPLTATQAGAQLGESAASCSFHLRQLAKYGLVEEAGRGRGRARPWRATAQFTRWPTTAGSPDLAAAADHLSAVVAERYFDLVMRWLDRRRDEPQEWQQAALLGDSILYLTAEELVELGAKIWRLTEGYHERTSTRALRPPGSRQVNFVHLAFPGE